MIRASAAWALAAAFVCAPALVAAHPDYEDRLRLLDRGADPAACDPDLHLKRGDVLRTEGLADAALAEYERAAACPGPGIDRSVIDLARAHALLRADLAEAAEALADHVLDDEPGSTEARLVRARARVRMRHLHAAAEDFAIVTRALKAPQPDHFFEWARALEAAGDPAAAVAALDEGIARLGPITSLAREAIRIEADAGHFDAAIARVDRLVPSVPPREAWLMLRAELLARADRRAEAVAAYRDALAALAAHPRRSAAIAQLESEARVALARLTATRRHGHGGGRK